MSEITKLIVGVLLFAVVAYGGAQLIGLFTLSTPTDLPGYGTGENLETDIETHIGSFQDTTEEESDVGVGGLIGLVKDVILNTPRYVSEVVSGWLAYFGIPGFVGNMLRAAVYIVVIWVGILLLRGVK